MTPVLLAALSGLLGVVIGLALRLRRDRASARQGLRSLSRRRLLGWIDASPSGWVILDRADRVVHLNPRAQQLLQIDGGRRGQGLTLARLCADAALLEAVQRSRRLDRPQRLEWTSPEGDLDLLVMPTDGGWLALVLSSRRSLEAQLAQQERWVSDVAHELKTPLTALLLVGDSLAECASPQNARLVQRLQRELLRLQQLVGDLLELSRLENTVPDALDNAQSLPLAALVEQVWQGLRPIAQQRQLRLVLEGRDDLCVQADAARVHRALLNLLDNALRYSPDGGAITVTLQESGLWGAIAVRDQGPGFSDDDQDHLFERFYRGDPSRARGARTGSGLGLAIVQQIAAAHGGRVVAGNHPAGGAKVELLLPAAPPLPRVPAATPALPR
ncbi:MAG: HAMP domain-containing sensor histidine kinase [Cyanobacteriota bacterium]|nr:HAMP domain-containing sensor histidine kinase [Cyanobacteriota bacterium]